MEVDRPTGARRGVRIGHVVVGLAALVLAGTLIATALRPDAELEGLLIIPGVALAVIGAVFTVAAFASLRRGRGSGLVSLVLSLLEVIAGVAAAVGLVEAVRDYGAFEPWRSPLLVPMLVLLAVGLAGVAFELRARRQSP